jgi:hypothetical protein
MLLVPSKPMSARLTEMSIVDVPALMTSAAWPPSGIFFAHT